MYILADFDLLGLIVLIFTLLVIGAMQVGAALGIMYGMHKLVPEKLTQTKYLDFDFDHFYKPAFLNHLARLAVIFVGLTFVLHTADFIIVGTLIRKYRVIVCFALFVLETAGIAAGLFYIFRLDRYRWMVLTVGSAFFYLFCLWFLVARGGGFLC